MSNYNLNNYYIVDCIEAMKELADKSFDLCLTDPPWNINLGSLGKDRQAKSWHDFNYFDKKNIYTDVIDDYLGFSKTWFSEARRICRQVIFTPGNDENFYMFLDIEKPKEILIHYKRDCVAFTHSVRFRQHDWILCYGDLRPFEFRDSILDIPLGGSGLTKELDLTHPCPKNIELWRTLMKRAKPKTVLDPFLGSGTTLQVAIEQGVKYLAFEIERAYISDIEKRIKRGKETREKKDKKKIF